MRASLHKAYLKLRRSLRNSYLGDRTGSPAADGDLNYHVDRFSIFQGKARLAGWAFSETYRIRRAFLITTLVDYFPIKSYGLKSKDVAKLYGIETLHARFA